VVASTVDLPSPDDRHLADHRRDQRGQVGERLVLLGDDGVAHLALLGRAEFLDIGVAGGEVLVDRGRRGGKRGRREKREPRENEDEPHGAYSARRLISKRNQCRRSASSI
jgi:hypothetical protein